MRDFDYALGNSRWYLHEDISNVEYTEQRAKLRAFEVEIILEPAQSRCSVHTITASAKHYMMKVDS